MGEDRDDAGDELLELEFLRRYELMLRERDGHWRQVRKLIGRKKERMRRLYPEFRKPVP